MGEGDCRGTEIQGLKPDLSPRWTHVDHTADGGGVRKMSKVIKGFFCSPTDPPLPPPLSRETKQMSGKTNEPAKTLEDCD